MKKFLVLVTLFASFFITGCTRIQTGEVGIRINSSKEISGNELMPGSWNQTMIGDVLTFPTKDISVALENKTPMTSDNSALADFDITVVYGISPTSVSELYTTKSKSFHAYDEKERDTYLMYHYVNTLVNNAAYKVVREYKSLEVADNRAKIEGQIRDVVMEQLKSEKLDTAITLSVVQIRNILPNADILASATAYVRSQNEIKIKENEVKLAKLEAERMAALSSNSTQSIAYINAQANATIANAVANGKVNTIIIPSSLTSLMIGK